MLPVLCCAREPLSVPQCAWLAKAEEEQVLELLQYMSGLLPRRVAGAKGELCIYFCE